MNFKKIFELYREETPIYKIAKEVKLPPITVSQVISGSYTIPPDQIQELKEIGFKICSCCRKRIVPLQPLEYVTLTKLCYISYKRGNPEPEYSVHLSSLNYYTN